MTDLTDAIEGMRQRMLAQSHDEAALVAALGAALAEADDRILRGVRLLAAEHAARRGAIGQELAALAASLGRLPPPARIVPLPGAVAPGVPPGPLPRFLENGRAA